MSRLEDIFRTKLSKQHFEPTTQNWKSLADMLNEHDKNVRSPLVKLRKIVGTWLLVIALIGTVVIPWHNEAKELQTYDLVGFDPLQVASMQNKALVTSYSENKLEKDNVFNSINDKAVENTGLNHRTNSPGQVNITPTVPEPQSTSTKENPLEHKHMEETSVISKNKQSLVYEANHNAHLESKTHYPNSEPLIPTKNNIEILAEPFSFQSSLASNALNEEKEIRKFSDDLQGMKSLLLTELLIDIHDELQRSLTSIDTNALASKFELAIRIGVHGGPMTVDNLKSGNNVIKRELSYNVGVSINLRSNAWSFETGLNYFEQKKISQLDFWTSTDQSYWDINTITYSIITDNNYWSPQDTSIYYWNESTLQYDSITVTTLKYIVNGVDTVYREKTDTIGYVTNIVSTKEVQNIPAVRYIEIPVLIGYEIAVNRITLFLQTGIGIGILSGYNRVVASTEKVNNPEMNKVVWSYLLKAGFLYHFTDHLSLSITPHFRMNLSNAVKEKGSVGKYQNLGVNIGIMYNF